MIIKSLKLKNIRSYTQGEVSFSSGSTLLNGDIGSGKTTILLAIEFALFGADNNKLSGGALLRKGANEASVELTFSVLGKEYVISRALKKTKRGIQQTPGHVLVDGVRTDGVATELRAKVIELLGYPQDMLSKKKNILFHYTVFCPQEEMKHILSEPEEMRLDTLRKIFGVDKYRQIRDNSFTLIKTLRRRVADLKIRCEKLPQLEEEKKILQESSSTLATQLTNLSSPLTEAKEKLENLKETYKQLEDKILRKHELEKKKTFLETQSKEKGKQIAEYKEKILLIEQRISSFPQLSGTKEYIEEQRLALREKLDDYQQKLSATSAQETEMKKRLQELTADLAQLQELISQKDNKKQEVVRLQEKIVAKAGLEEKKTELESKIKKSEVMLAHYKAEQVKAKRLTESISGLDNCPTCLQEVGVDHKEHIVQKEQKNVDFCGEHIQTIEQRLTSEKADVLKITQELQQIQEFMLQLERLKLEVENITRQEEIFLQKKKKIEEIQEEQLTFVTVKKELSKIDVIELQKNLDILNKEYKLLMEKQLIQKQLAEHKVSVERASQEVDELTAGLLSVIEELRSYEDVAQRNEDIKKSIEQEQTTYQDLLLKTTKLTSEKEQNIRLTEKLSNEITEQKAFLQHQHKISGQVNWLTRYFVPLMGNMEKHVMNRIHQQFSHFFEHWFALLIDDDTITARLSDTFLPLVEQNGYDVDVAHLSGGERTSAALAYRLALNKVINEVISTINTKDLIILDEPTDGFSSEQLDRMRDVLDELKVNQLIIVSHENKIESFVDRVIRVEKGESSDIHSA